MSKKMPFDTAIGIVSEMFKTDIDHTTDRENLKSKVVDAQREMRIIQDNEADDAQLTAAREIVKDLSKGYRAKTTTEVAKIVVVLQRLEELGDA